LLYDISSKLMPATINFYLVFKAKLGPTDSTQFKILYRIYAAGLSHVIATFGKENGPTFHFHQNLPLWTLDCKKTL